MQLDRPAFSIIGPEFALNGGDTSDIHASATITPHLPSENGDAEIDTPDQVSSNSQYSFINRSQEPTAEQASMEPLSHPNGQIHTDVTKPDYEIDNIDTLVSRSTCIMRANTFKYPSYEAALQAPWILEVLTPIPAWDYTDAYKLFLPSTASTQCELLADKGKCSKTMRQARKQQLQTWQTTERRLAGENTASTKATAEHPADNVMSLGRERIVLCSYLAEHPLQAWTTAVTATFPT
jgi:hypothetical protein